MKKQYKKCYTRYISDDISYNWFDHTSFSTKQSANKEYWTFPVLVYYNCVLRYVRFICKKYMSFKLLHSRERGLSISKCDIAYNIV